MRTCTYLIAETAAALAIAVGVDGIAAAAAISVV